MNELNFKLFLEMSMKLPPHIRPAWWDRVLSQAKETEEELADIKKTMESAITWEHDYFSNRPFRELWERNTPYVIKKIFSKEDNYYKPETLSKLIQDYKDAAKIGVETHTLTMMFKRIGNFYNTISDKGIKDFYKEYKRNFVSGFAALMEELEYNKKDILEGDYEEIEETFKKGKKLIEKLIQYVRLSLEVKEKIEAWQERAEINHNRYSSYNSGPTMPKHAARETLYHATPYIKEILSQGFKTKSELGGIEVLGVSTQTNNNWDSEGLAFTADYNIAHAIAVAVTEAIKIAKGEITLKDVMNMFKNESPTGAKASEFKTRADSWRYDYRSYFKKKKLGFSRMFPDDKFDPATNVYDTDRQQAFQLYRRYLGTSKLRYDPLFFGVTIKNFEKLDENNVGIIAAVVDMSKIKHYLEGMEEFRVPKDAILKYWQIKRT